MAHPYTDDLNLTLAVAVAIVRIPEDIRGYGYAKERHLATACPPGGLRGRSLSHLL